MGGFLMSLMAMQPGWVLLLIVAAFWSIVTSFVAIFRILANKFHGDKLSWILICMVGFIGPILWLTKGRKLIIKHDGAIYQNSKHA